MSTARSAAAPARCPAESIAAHPSGSAASAFSAMIARTSGSASKAFALAASTL
jgi:hypothetical protein